MPLPTRATRAAAAGLALALGACAVNPGAGIGDRASWEAQVRAAETAFARSMAQRDFEAFAGFISDSAVFVNHGQPLRGKPAVLAHWKRFFDGAQAPFSWMPQIVEVTADGRLGYSEGPVSLPDGRVPSRYFSTWRLESDGRWRVAFDNGYDLPATTP
jgi:ketosteroid isomerase-like protein